MNRWTSADLKKLQLGMDPRKYNPPCPTEDAEHSAVIRYLAHAYPKARWSHAANEGKRTKAQQGAIKRQGVSAGFFDLLILDWRGPRALFLEMKRVRGSKISPAQESWLEWLQKAGYTATICRGFDEARVSIDNFFNNKT